MLPQLHWRHSDLYLFPIARYVDDVSTELTRLWNLCPDNMESCRSKERDFLPSLEAYFEEAIEQLDPSVESQYKWVATN